MKVIIENMAGEKLEFHVEPHDTVLSLKQKFLGKEGVPVDQQKFLFKNEDMHN